MFEIKATSNEVIDGGTFTVSWCVDAETVKYLVDQKITDPQVVIIIAPQGRTYNLSKESRVVVPLKDLLAYVSFRVPGPNRIFAFIDDLSISSASRNHAKSKFLSQEYGEYKTTLLTFEGDELDYPLAKEIKTEPLSVIVPVDVFAREPAQWEKAWVNHFFRNKSVDQCDFRRRRLLAYSVQPIVLLGDWLIRLLLFTVGLLFGCRDLTIKPLFHLLSMGIEGMLRATLGSNGTIFIQRLPEDHDLHWHPETMWDMLSYVFRKFWALPLMPFISLTILSLSIASHGRALLFFGWALLVIPLIITLFAFFASRTFIDFLVWCRNLFRDKTDQPWYLDAEELDLLSCTNQKTPRNFQQLPAHHKTLRLRYKDLKAKVCKPFSV